MELRGFKPRPPRCERGTYSAHADGPDQPCMASTVLVASGQDFVLAVEPVQRCLPPSGTVMNHPWNAVLFRNGVVAFRNETT